MFQLSADTQVQSQEKWTAEDAKILQDFLLCKCTESNGKNFDLNNDGRWDVFDLCLLRRELTENQHKNNILIAYFTRADNVDTDSIADIDLDAVTSASLVTPGNAEIIANHIQKFTDGDMFSIIVNDKYSADYESCLNRVSQEQATAARPELSNHIDNMEQYDTVFIGFPNWAYTCPMAVFSFIEEYDFSGKTIIPFCTCGTGGFAGTIMDITNALPENCTILSPIGISRSEISGCGDSIEKWLMESEVIK